MARIRNHLPISDVDFALAYRAAETVRDLINTLQVPEYAVRNRISAMTKKGAVFPRKPRKYHKAAPVDPKAIAELNALLSQ